MTATSFKDEPVIFEEFGDTGSISINRPSEANAFNLNMILSIIPILRDWEKHKALVLVKSRVPKFFGTGGDAVRVLEEAKLQKNIGSYYARYAYEVIHIIASMKTPFVSLNNGLTMGGSTGMCIYSKYFVCTENTDFSTPECRIGHFVDCCLSYFLCRLKNHLGYYIALTAAKIKGYDNVCAGLATHFCPSEKLPLLEKALLEKPHNVDDIIKSFATAPKNAAFSLEPYLQKIDQIFSCDTVEEIMEKLEKDGSKWCERVAATMRQMCPLSLKVTLRQLQRAKSATLEECVQMEYVLANTLYGGANFKEGVRARLKDYDNKPMWIPRTLKEVTPEMVEDLYHVKPLMGEMTLHLKENRS